MVVSSICIKARKSRSSQRRSRLRLAGSGEHGIASVAVASFEVIASHPVFGLHMPNDRLNRGTTTHLAADWRGDVLHLAADPDAELLGMVVAAIAFVDVDAAGLDPGQPSPAITCARVWPSNGLPCSALACSTN